MNFLRKHWYDLGSVPAILIICCMVIFKNSLTNYQILIWLNLAGLFLHQLEEYRFPGTFPGMINTALYKSDLPDRYPLNTNTSFYVNVVMGWTVYLLAAIFAEQAVWLGLATLLISFGNIVLHTIVFNIKAKTFYNAGLLTSWLCFAPCIYFFFKIGYSDHLIVPTDYLIGLPLGILLDIIGIIKLIDWLADKNTPYVFPARSLFEVPVGQ